MTTDTGQGTPRPKRESHPRNLIMTERGECYARKHGTADAYQHHGCRCPIARRALRRQIKARQLAHIEGRPPLIDATGTRRRLQALAAAGHSLADIASHLDRARETVHDWQTRHDPVTRATHDAVAAAYQRLADRSPVGPRVTRVRNDARRKGWLPPLWWDDDTIDDPTYRPTCTHKSTACAPTVDPVVVERLIDGQPPLHVTKAERAEAVRTLHCRGRTNSQIGQQLGISGTRVRQILTATVREATDTHATDDCQESA